MNYNILIWRVFFFQVKKSNDIDIRENYDKSIETAAADTVTTAVVSESFLDFHYQGHMW